MGWIDLSEDLTEQAMVDFQVGQILGFDYEGSKTWFRVMRKRNGKLWVKEITTYHPDQVEVVDKVE